MVLVLEGSVRVLRTDAGRRTVIHSGNAGDTLGEVPFFTRGTYPATAIATERTRCLWIAYSAVEHALGVDPTLALFLLERLSQRIDSLVDRVAQLSAQSVKSRLAAFILERGMGTQGRDPAAPLSWG